VKPKTERVLALALLTAAAALSSCGGKSGPASGSTAKVIKRDFASSVLATGAVKPQVGAEVRVGARISGKVEQLYANIGDEVDEGDAIAELEKAELKATEARCEAELEMVQAKLSAVARLRPKEIEKAEADVAQCEASLTLAKQELDRQKELLGGGSATQAALDEAQERFSVAEAKLASSRKALELARLNYAEDVRLAEAEVKRAEAVLAGARAQLSYATITAPISGVIGSVSTQKGETVAAGLNAPTFVTITDLERLQVDAYVDEVDIGKVRRGQRAVFTVDAFPAREFEGEVTAIYPQAVIQENVVNYDVVIGITSEYKGLLRPEMTASVTIFLEDRSGVLAVPARAVKRQRGRTVVYVLVDGRPELREVTVGWRDGQWIEIAEGLKQGETVLLDAPASE
jgi:multidrug efflux pump subunit AcrA (membrane-fusion protein)